MITAELKNISMQEAEDGIIIAEEIEDETCPECSVELEEGVCPDCGYESDILDDEIDVFDEEDE